MRPHDPVTWVIDLIEAKSGKSLFVSGFDAGIELKSSVIFFWQPVPTQSCTSIVNERRVAEFNHQSAAIKNKKLLCNLPRHWAF
ncbi:MAG: hypothetical protein HQ457_10750 [Betaproteobacteria bacterium]|nr:hypothetical protein [Betaproteobacteria bacterium]